MGWCYVGCGEGGAWWRCLLADVWVASAVSTRPSLKDSPLERRSILTGGLSALSSSHAL